jgi:hypothetical protein
VSAEADTGCAVGQSAELSTVPTHCHPVSRAELLALTGGKPGGVLPQITGVGSISRDAISVYC